MKKILLVVAIAAALSACSKEAPEANRPGAPAIIQVETNSPQAYDVVAQKAKGFSVGQMMSSKTVYVLFDPKCPHCAHLWENTKALHSGVHFVWIPVSLLGNAEMKQESANEGAALLKAASIDAMDKHEKALLSGKPTAMDGATDELRTQVKVNNEVALQIKMDSVPLMFYKDAATGAVRTASGGLTADEVKKRLGL